MDVPAPSQLETSPDASVRLPTLELTLLGDFRATVDGVDVPRDAWKQRRAADLVKLLALAPRHRFTRDEIIESLWPGAAPEAGGTNVRKAIHFTRRALSREDAIGVRGGLVELWPAGVLSTDIDRFEEASRQALELADIAALRDAAGLYAGDLLPDDLAEPWTEPRRRSLRGALLTVLRQAGLWARIVELEPTDEEAHRQLMQAHLAAGNRQAAMRQFERLREVLREELGVGPDRLSVELYDRVLEDEGRDVPTAAERARALLAWGMIHWKRRDLEEAERTALEARALAVDAGLGAQVGEASSLLASIGMARGNWRNFLRDELVETVRRTPNLAPFVFDSNLCFTEFCLYLPNGTAEMATFAEELADAAAEAGSKRGLALAALTRGETELLEGRLAEAEADLERALELYRETDTTSGQSMALERLAEVATASGQRWKARRRLRAAQRLADGDPLGSHLLVKVQGAMVEAAADPPEAAGVARHGEQVLADSEVCQQCSMSFRMAAATAYTEVGDVPNASRHLEEAERVSEMWQGGPWTAAVRNARSKLDRAISHRPAS